MFKKGRKKTGGREKGTPNKVKSQFKKQLEGFAVDNFAEFIEVLNQIDNPLEKAKIYVKVLEFVMPKQKYIELDGDVQVSAVKVEFNKTGVLPVHEEEEKPEN